MRVLHLINNLRREGAQLVVYNLVTAPRTQDVDHVVCLRDGSGPLCKELEGRGVPVFYPNRYFGLAAAHKAVRFIERVANEQSIDVIHSHMADAAFLGWRAARRLGVPLVITHHGHDILPVCGRICRAVHFVLLMLAARYADRNIAVSGSVAERVNSTLPLASPRLTVIPNGVPVPDSGVVQEAVAARAAGRQRVVTVGRLVPLKGQTDLVAAAGILAGRGLDIEYQVVGDGPMREGLERRVQEEGLSERFAFAGAVDDVTPYLRGGSAFVSTSRSEGMPMAVLEAMAWRVPVIASDIAGHRGVVSEGGTGWLFPPGDCERLADAIARALSEPAERRRRADGARDRVVERYSVAASSEAHQRMYEDVLARANG